ncbi:MAG: FKBP-type peptidyl-prolyl cis-trans isomerase [bacterium]
MDSIQEGSLVSVEYTLSLEDGTEVESNKGEDPMVYRQGNHEIIPALERELEGMRVGDAKRIQVDPEDAYGEQDMAAFVEVTKENFPDDALAPGTPLKAEDPQGKTVYMRVHEVKEETVVLDLNHPLAGETLVFDVRVLDIRDGGGSDAGTST